MSNKKTIYDQVELKQTQLKLPICFVKFPRLGTEPDKFGKIGALFLLDPENEEHKKFLDNVQDIYQDFKKQVESYHPNPRVSPLTIRKDTDKEGELTGFVALKITRDAKTKNGKQAFFKIVGADNTALNTDQKNNIWSGSRLYGFVELHPWEGLGQQGIKFRIVALKVVSISGGQSDVSSLFDDDGIEGETPSAYSPDTSDGDDEDSNNELEETDDLDF